MGDQGLQALQARERNRDGLGDLRTWYKDRISIEQPAPPTYPKRVVFVATGNLYVVEAIRPAEGAEAQDCAVFLHRKIDGSNFTIRLSQFLDGRYRAEAASTEEQAHQAELDRIDAARWRALLACERVRVMGATHDLNHVGFEFWRVHASKHPSPAYPQESCRAQLTRFADLIVAGKALEGQADG